MNELTQIYKAIGALSEKVNDLNRRISDGVKYKYQTNSNLISENSDGLLDLASLDDENNEAITDLADYTESLEERIIELEGKING